ncbi:NADPH-ferrihemoprotein reductase [Rhizoctonia solani]|uniref:NADPH-ferrihemoprotein reductase n=1 Tax=Rhizoctonia solani TaxID=456999 RepID=A0A0K6FM90_9AGAM|nr:NADPH-ferrihemoprotein reductase [Rhizoctonia solani]
MTTPIPCPPGLPIVGNLTSVDADVPTNSLMLLAKQYGEIYRLRVLKHKGAKRLLGLGEGDAGGNSFLESFNEWEENLWDALAKEYNVEAKEGLNVPMVDVQLVGGPTDRAAILRQPDSRLGLVVENRVLTTPGAPAKHHIEFELPDSMTYQAGDYLAILPLNPPEYVRRVLARFRMSPEQEIVLNAHGPTALPTGKPVGVSEMLSGFVEIGQTVTKRNISTLLEHSRDPATRSDLEVMLSTYNLKEGNPQGSMLDLLEKYPDIDLPFGTFVASLPTMRLRQYSISSSPLWNPSRVTLTLAVVNHGQFLGVASNYLANLRKGDRVQMVVRPSAKSFHPPPDPSVPMVLFAAGSGMAPFRGFLQERAMQAQARRPVAKSVLFFGCRTPDEDYLYADKELAEWSELGVVDLRPAFSRASERSEGNKYVQQI